MTTRTNSHTVTCIYRRLIFHPSRNNVIDTPRDVGLEASGQKYLVTLTTESRDAEMISAKFSALVSNSTKQFMYYLLGLQVYFDLVQPGFFGRNSYRIGSYSETNTRYVLLIICILPKLLGLKIQFVQRRGNRYHLIRLLFEDTIKRY